MKQFISFISSMKLMAVLMLIFAAACGYATFVENDYGTPTAKAEIYNAQWFELLLIFLAINLVLNIYRYKMYTMKKAPIFIFHVAFLVILVGAAITRFVGFEGIMHIREGESSSTLTSSDTYLKVDVVSGKTIYSTSQKVYLSKRKENDLSTSLGDIDGKDVKVELIEYIPNAIEQTVESDSGDPLAEMMITSNGKGEKIALRYTQYYESDDVVIDFGSNETFSKPVISLYVQDAKLFMKHTMPLTYLKMDDGSKGSLVPNDKEPVTGRTLFSAGNSNFVLRKFVEHATTKIVTNPDVSPRTNGYDALKFKVTVGEKSKELMVFGQIGLLAKPTHLKVNGLDIYVSYGAEKIKLPFEIKLKKFELDRYPGSMSPASYASEVVLIDKEEGIEMPYRIYMNHILEHRGYRFFQSSFDQDEKGTVLSVNNDPGTWPSYFGYFLLALGMFWSLFSRGNRFSKLAEKARKASEAKMLPALLAVGLLFSFSPTYASEMNPALKIITSFDKEHANKFGELIVQDSAGRMKPLDTLANEIIAKIHRSSELDVGKYKLDADQVILGMMMRPEIYREIKLIRTKEPEVNKLVGVPENEKFVSFAQFFDDPVNLGGYKLAKNAEEAARKEPKHRNKFDKAVLKIDEKVNIAYMVFSGELIRIWPKPNDINDKWYPTIEALQTWPQDEAMEVRNIAVEYFTAIDDALKSGNWSAANTALEKIAKYQKFYGSDVYPSKNRIAAEVFYNKVQIFERLYPFYLLVGFILLVLSFINIIKPKFNIAIYSKISLYLLVVFFILHTFGLGLRWYIAEHAPWSDGYESMIYIGWATVLAGFIFSKRSPMTMASTGIVAGRILFVAHLNWMNPQVTNLVPVLNSYWLSIHVSMITASYGFLGLGALLGFITIILFILKNKDNEKRISLSIKELNAINEMSLMVGLVLLTIGNFLGGVWANESWGRYWGWDPKETWALVTILVYAVVVHLRFIKSIYSEFNYSVISLLSFTSVIMTYFGVNYYLAGMHSYAKGDPVPIPDFVPVTYLIIFVIIALAYRNRNLAK